MRLQGLSFIRSGLRRVRRSRLTLLASIAAVSGSIWLFLALADEVLERETAAVDEAILLALRSESDRSDPLGPGWLEEMGRDFTALGGVGVLTLLTLCSCVYLLLIRRARSAVFAVVAISSGWLVSNLLKLGFDRPRPDLVPHGSIVYTASFPSGHAMMSAVTYLTLAVLLGSAVSSWRLRSFFLATAMLLTMLVGISRVYLGVHWPTDVAAGWAVGAAWAGLCWLVEHYLQRRGVIEAEMPSNGVGSPGGPTPADR